MSTELANQGFSAAAMRVVYINLNSRPDRRKHMEAELPRNSFTGVRFPAIRHVDYVGPVDRRKFVGIGCYASHVKVIEEAIKLGKHTMILEDDVVFCADFDKRLVMIETFLRGREWDALWLGGTWHEPPHWHAAGHPHFPECPCGKTVDAEPVPGWPHFVRTYGCFCSFAYILNVNSAQKFLDMTKKLSARNYAGKGLDWVFLLMQPVLNTFAFTPGCVKQLDGQSDCRKGINHFSYFTKLGPHWFADQMDVLG